MSVLIDYIRTHFHEVPKEATIPEGVEYAVVHDNGSVFTPAGNAVARYRAPGRSYTRFTPEPLPEPTFELPTTPGTPIIAHDSLDETRRVLLRTSKGYWADPEGFYCDDEIRDPQPALVTPNGVGVMDETDKRDRVDASRDRWVWDRETDTWGCVGEDLACGTLAALAANYGPLRFAGEEVQQ